MWFLVVISWASLSLTLGGEVILPYVSHSCVIGRRNRSWSNKYTLLFLPLTLMSPFASEVFFGNYHEYFPICIEFNCLEAKLSILGWYCYLLPGYKYLLGVTPIRGIVRDMRSSLGMSASCVYVTEKREGLAAYSRRILWKNQFPELPRCSWL
jgi:hypothetical protein